MWTIFGYDLIAMAIGAMVGLSELLSRYPWSVSNVAKSKAGWAYLALNAGVSLLAYQAAVEWQIPSELNNKSEIWRVFLASIFGMAMLRSSFLNIRIGNENLPTGFATIVNIFMRRAERSLDQDVVTERWSKIEPLVADLTYVASRDYFVAVVGGALRSLSVNEIDALNKAVEKIDSTMTSDDTKLQLLAMLIIDITSIELFTSLAKKAKSKLATENKVAIQRKSENQKLLSEIKDILRR